MSTPTLVPPPAARDVVRTWALAPGWIACGLLVVVFAFDPSTPLWVQYLPLALSVVLVGLPHGALDHLVPSRLRGEPATLRSLAAVGFLYAALGGTYAAGWFLAPAVCFVGFILLTLVHWGQGDVHALVALAGGDHLRTRPQRALAAVTRGGFPMLVPLVAFPEQYRRVAEALVSPFLGNADVLALAFTAPVRLAVAVGVVLLVTAHLAVGYLRRSTSRRGFRYDAGETLLLGVFFSTVPPILAVGTYFCLWHATRHVARLVLLDPPAVDALSSADIGTALRRFTRQAAPLTLASLGFLLALYLFVPEPPTTIEGLVGLYLVLIAALTLPHVVVVAWMDRAQGVWSPRVA